MRYFGIWYGGNEYSFGGSEDSLELFPSLDIAKRCLEQRYNSNGMVRQTFFYVNRDWDSVFCPLVDRESEIHLWQYTGPDMVDLWTFDHKVSVPDYPDLRVFFGPRMGVRVEEC